MGIAALSEKVVALDDRLKKVETGVTTSQKGIADALTRIEGRLAGDVGPFAPIVLTEDEIQIIRGFLSVKGKANGEPGFTIGDPVPEALLRPVPDLLAAKLPKLMGAKFVFNNGYLILAGAGNRVIAIISPV